MGTGGSLSISIVRFSAGPDGGMTPLHVPVPPGAAKG
jgi:hypothetical protein